MKCDEPGCNEPKEHFHLSQEDIDAYEAISRASKLQAAGAEIERTRTVSLHDHADLLDHLKSDNGHIMGPHAEYRNSHDNHIPGVRPIDPDWDHELTHRELIALHQHDHNKYPDDKHTTIDGEHFHH